MKYCKKCLQPDTRPGIVFDEHGVCMACRNEEARNEVVWHEREKALFDIAVEAKKKKAMYDAVIGVSGGKDSHVQAMYCKEDLGLNCLLVNCAPDGISEPGKRNLENLVQKGFDMISMRPNPVVERSLSRMAFFKYGNFVKPLEYPLYTSAFMIADKFDIPLVIQGENDADVFGVNKLPSGPDAFNWVDVDTVSGCNASDFYDFGFGAEELRFYQFPDRDRMKEKGIKAIFLAYYIREWGHWNNTYTAVSYGLSGRDNHDPMRHGKINRYSSLDADLKIVNQMIKYLKYGFGQATDEVCYAIRESLMTREQGIQIVEKYDGKCGDDYIHALCEYLSIPIWDFYETLDKFVNKELFEKKNGSYVRRFEIGV